MPQSLSNRPEHRIEIPHHIAVGKAKHTKPHFAQCPIPRGIVTLPSGMCVAIDFDHQHLRSAGEIDDAATAYGLSTKLDTPEAFRSQRVPEPLLGGCHLAAHLPSVSE